MGTGAEVIAPELLAGFGGADAAAGGLLAAETAGAGVTAAEAGGLTALGDAAVAGGTAAAGTGIAADAAAGGSTAGDLSALGTTAGQGATTDLASTAAAGAGASGGALADAGAAAASVGAGAGAGAIPSAAGVGADTAALNLGAAPTNAAIDAGVGATGSGGASLPFGAGGDASGSTGAAGAGATGAAGDAGSAYEQELLAKVRAEQAASAVKTGAEGAGIGQKLLDQITKNPLTAGALGLNVAGQLNAQKAGKTSAAQLQKLSQPVQDVSNSLLSQYQAGTINPSTSFDIQQWKNQQIATAKNYYAKAGISDSDAARSAIANIEAKAVAMEDQARQGLLTQGLSAAGVAQGPATAAITAQAAQDQALSTASGSALNSLMLLNAMQNNGMSPVKTGG